MEDISALRDVIIIFTVSIGVVFLFQKIHFPSIAGFLVAGTLVGPYGLNLISDREQIQVLAEVGVILRMGAAEGVRALHRPGGELACLALFARGAVQESGGLSHQHQRA